MSIYKQSLDFRNGTYIELGANDGIDQSNSRHFEKFRNWKGVLVEPTPHNFLSCLKHRSPETSIFCNACVSFEYSEKFVEIVYSNLMSTPLGLESDIDNPLEHANLGQQFLNSTDKIFSFGAIAIPLNNLLEKAKSPKLIDYYNSHVDFVSFRTHLKHHTALSDTIMLYEIDHHKQIGKKILIEYIKKMS